MDNDVSLAALLMQRLAGDHRSLEDRLGLRSTVVSRVTYVRTRLMLRALHLMDDSLRRKFRVDCGRRGMGDKERRLHGPIDLGAAALGQHDRSAGAAALSAAIFGSFAKSPGASYVVLDPLA
jgi:hypothetical protein